MNALPPISYEILLDNYYAIHIPIEERKEYCIKVKADSEEKVQDMIVSITNFLPKPNELVDL